MTTSRPAKTLIALIATMTVGTFTLLALETDPIRSPIRDAAMVVAPEKDIATAVDRTSIPVPRSKWKNVVLHFSPADVEQLRRQNHFLVYPDESGQIARVEATELWRAQRDGQHVDGPHHGWNTNSIGICLVGDYTGRDPDKGQFRALVGLVQAVQRVCRITPDRVYFDSEMDPSSPAMGKRFVASFNRMLLKL